MWMVQLIGWTIATMRPGYYLKSCSSSISVLAFIFWSNLTTQHCDVATWVCPDFWQISKVCVCVLERDLLHFQLFFVGIIFSALVDFLLLWNWNKKKKEKLSFNLRNKKYNSTKKQDRFCLCFPTFLVKNPPANCQYFDPGS